MRPEITQHCVDIMQGMATKMARGQDERDELISEGWVTLVEMAEAFDADRGIPFEVYVGKYMRARLIDARRHLYGRTDDGQNHDRYYFNLRQDSLDDLAPHVERQRSPELEENLVAQDLWVQFHEAVSTMTERHQDVLLSTFRGESDKDLAERLGVTLSTVYTTRKQARTRLRWKMDYQGERTRAPSQQARGSSASRR